MSIKLKAVRLHEVSSIVSSLKPQEIADVKKGEPLKAIRQALSLEKDLSEVDPLKKLKAKLREETAPINEEYREKHSKAEEKDRPAVLKEHQEKINEAVRKFNEREKVSEKEQEEVVLELSGEKTELLKLLMEKYGLEKYNSKEALIEVMDALEG